MEHLGTVIYLHFQLELHPQIEHPPFQKFRKQSPVLDGWTTGNLLHVAIENGLFIIINSWFINLIVDLLIGNAGSFHRFLGLFTGLTRPGMLKHR